MSLTPALDKFNEEVREQYGITPEQSRFYKERAHSDARHNEASALRHAREQGEESVCAKWQGVVAEKDAAIANQAVAIASQAEENERLRAQIAELQSKARG